MPDFKSSPAKFLFVRRDEAELLTIEVLMAPQGVLPDLTHAFGSIAPNFEINYAIDLDKGQYPDRMRGEHQGRDHRSNIRYDLCQFYGQQFLRISVPTQEISLEDRLLKRIMIDLGVQFSGVGYATTTQIESQGVYANTRIDIILVEGAAVEPDGNHPELSLSKLDDKTYVGMLRNPFGDLYSNTDKLTELACTHLSIAPLVRYGDSDVRLAWQV